MHNYLKKNELEDVVLGADEFFEGTLPKSSKIRYIKIGSCLAICLIIFICFSVISLKNMQGAEVDTIGNIELVNAPVAAASARKNVISIPTGMVKANPFVPYRTLGNEVKTETLVNDVPKFDLIAPPETLGENQEAAKIMDTVVSGILFDKFSPSAILKIDGNDYLVKKGDTVNNYKVIAIAQDSVTVKLGNNTYKAGIGEILTEGRVNHNDVSNLSKKFGGEQR